MTVDIYFLLYSVSVGKQLWNHDSELMCCTGSANYYNYISIIIRSFHFLFHLQLKLAALSL